METDWSVVQKGKSAAQAKKEMTDEEKKEQLKIDYLETFTSPHGQRVLDDLRKLSHFDYSVVPTGNDGHVDALDVMRNEGMRAVVIHILRKIEKKKEEKQTESE